jgi:hypothetical protein
MVPLSITIDHLALVSEPSTGPWAISLPAVEMSKVHVHGHHTGALLHPWFHSGFDADPGLCFLISSHHEQSTISPKYHSFHTHTQSFLQNGVLQESFFVFVFVFKIYFC